jgi:putative dehydrogenase
MSGGAAPASGQPVGVIGLGLMGSAIAARLTAAGRAVLGHDIDQARREAFEAAGSGAAVALSQLARRCRIIFIAVYDARQVRDVLDELAENAPGDPPLSICTTTCAPAEIAAIAAQAGDLRIALVEAPMSGTSAELRAGKAMALVGGAREAIAAAADVLEIVCAERVEAGRIGDAARMKLAINLILQGTRAALAEGIVFAETLGLDAKVFLDAARRSAAGSKVMDGKGEKMRLRDFAPQSHLSQTLKDAELILQEAKLHALALPMTSVQTGLLRAAILAEGPDADSSAVIAAIDPMHRERPR